MSSVELTDWMTYHEIHPIGTFESNAEIAKRVRGNPVETFRKSMQHLVKKAK